MKIEEYVKKSLVLAIGSSHSAIWRHLNVRLKSEKCSLLQSMILISMFFEKKTVTPSELAASLRTTRANMSHAISGIEKRRLIRRLLDPKDARSYQLALRPEGKRVAVRLIKVIDTFEGVFEERFGRSEVLAMVERLRVFEYTVG